VLKKEVVLMSFRQLLITPFKSHAAPEYTKFTIQRFGLAIDQTLTLSSKWVRCS